MNYSLGILKPDCIMRKLETKVLNIIEQYGLSILFTKRVKLSKNDVEIVYANCLKENFWHQLLDSYTIGESIVFIVYGKDAINRLNELVGFRDPQIAEQHTIRHQFGRDITYNIIHSTANEKSLKKEMDHFFSAFEQEVIYRQK